MRTHRMSPCFLAGLLAVAWPLAGKAEEGLTPYIPGITTGVPVGALPPPGFYGSEDNYVIFGDVRNGAGETIPIRVTNWSANVALLYSSPYHILGGTYGAGLIEIMANHNVDATDVGGPNTSSTGLFNTIIEPLTLSWSLGGGLFASIGQSFYLPDGEFHEMNGVRKQTSYANAFWTYEPSFAISYLKNGWNLTATNVYDVNAEDTLTHYQSGDVYYLDLTAVKTVGRVTAGLIGNYTQQTGDDRQDGATVGRGNRAQHVMLGPLLAYRIGGFTFTARFLSDVRTQNDVNLSEVHLSVATRF